MTCSIFDSTANLIDAFGQRDASVIALRALVQAEPPRAEGEMVGEAIYRSAGA